MGSALYTLSHLCQHALPLISSLAPQTKEHAVADTRIEAGCSIVSSRHHTLDVSTLSTPKATLKWASPKPCASSMILVTTLHNRRVLLRLNLWLASFHCGSTVVPEIFPWRESEIECVQVIVEAHCGGVSRALYKRSMSIQASIHRLYESPKGMTEARSMQSSLQRAPSSVCGVNCGEAQAEQKTVASARRHSRFM